MIIGIKEGKIWDICSAENFKRPDRDMSVEYVDMKENNNDFYILDTWDKERNINLKDSPLRLIPPEKTPLELKIIDLELRISELEKRINTQKV